MGECWMKHALFALLTAGAALVVAPVQAQTSPLAPSATLNESSAPTTKKVVKKKPAKKVEEPAVVDEEAAEPSNIGSVATEYKCEMGNTLTVFTNNDDNQHIALKWGKRLHRMTRVSTTTGASRFENKYYGLVWIGIPSKGILLDSKNGHQLANDCKSPEQLAPPPS
jgi:hypothetical protein